MHLIAAAEREEVMRHAMNSPERGFTRFMIFGASGAGKTTLLRALEGKAVTNVLKTQMIDYSGWGIDTPGEFSEIGRLRRILVAASFDAQLLLAVHDATRHESSFPPNYFLALPQKTIGVVTKIDDPTADPQNATALLREAGVTGEVFYASALTGEGIAPLQTYLTEFAPPL